MQKAIASFALIAVLTALLMALGLMVARQGYPFGVTGMKRWTASQVPTASFLSPLSISSRPC